MGAAGEYGGERLSPGETMRRTIVGVSVAVVLAACMHTAPREAAAPPPPLDVTLLPALAAHTVVPSLTFTLNRPAYVAAFEIIPGRGVRLLYPYAPQADVRPGGMSLVTETPEFYDDYLRSALTAPFGGATYTYIVASDKPLALGTFTQPAGLLDYFGDARFASYRASSFIDAVTAAVVPADAEDGSWSWDLVVDWSNDPAGALADATTSLRCANGRIIAVPAAYGSALCPLDAVRPVRPSVAASSSPRSSAMIQSPGTIATGERPAAPSKAPRRHPWWAGSAGNAWIGSLSPAEMSPVEVAAPQAHAVPARGAAARVTAASPQTAQTRTVTRPSSPASPPSEETTRRVTRRP